ncbi:MAG: hypothetical protein JNL74_21445 [Fibrobacteres bacterium]|nr:hypothetical protein [Fibrobacterota bacterium]
MENNRPLVYLDHNILSAFTKGQGSEILNLLRDESQVVYSTATLKEIMQSKGYEKAFLKTLVDLNANYMELQLDENFRIIDKIRQYSADPNVVFEQHKISNSFTDPSMFIQKLFGGMQERSFSDIIDEEWKATLERLDQAVAPIKEFTFLLEQMKSHGGKINSDLKSTLQKAIPQQINFNPVSVLRTQIEQGPDSLNNLQGARVIERIWAILSKKPGMPDSFEALCGQGSPEIMAAMNPNNTLYLKVVSMHAVLQMLGYWPDKNCNKSDRFNSFIQDQYHTANAIFTTAFITLDKRLAMKARAIYEYLGVSTKVILFQSS